MGKHVLYYSEFYSRLNVPYRIEIWRKSDIGSFRKPVTLSGAPIEIEWNEVDKLDPVHSSSATLRLVSMTDRQFVELYTVEPASIGLDVFREGKLYWSGTLDTELFEEPYSYKDRYVTTVTFSDFGILDRLDWEVRGIKSMSEVLQLCLHAAGFNYTWIEKHISTKLSEAYEGDLLDSCSLICENFFDEDDEPMSMREVLDEILRPFALHLKQKNGRLVLFDINSLTSIDPTPVVWSGTDAELGVEPGYNKVTITFSPYTSGTIFDGTLDHDEILSDKTGGELIYTQRPKDGNASDPNVVEGFRIVHGTPTDEKMSGMELSGAVELYRIDAEYSGSDEAGIMWGYRPDDEWRGREVFNPFDDDAALYPFFVPEIIKTPRKLVINTNERNKYRHKLKITLNVLFDTRYNPFENASLDNEKGNWEDLCNWVNFGYIPMQLFLYDNDGTLRYYYSNNTMRYADHLSKSGVWKEAKPDDTDEMRISWLCYYDESNRKSSTGFGGWKKNKQMVARHLTSPLPSAFTASIEGEKMYLPPISGYIELTVCGGLWRVDHSGKNPYPNIYPLARWLLYKEPKIEIIKANGRNLDENDVVVSAWLDKRAKEEVELSTIIGTPRNIIPSGRGYVLRTSDYMPIQQFHRAGVTDSLERLLAGTIYSNYARRMNTLRGTVALISEAEVLSDNSMVNSRYMLLSEVQNLSTELSEIKMVEITPDSYEGVEYES